MARKIIIGFVSGIILLALVLGIFICIQVKQMKPVYTGTQKISGLRHPVTLVWDSSGVIHITGQTTEDVIFASGFAVAKERLWQMDLLRRVAKGRLSEAFGETGLQADKLFLTLGIDSLTHSMYQKLSPESIQWLELYAKGINAYLEEMGKDMPAEFLLTKIKPERWTPQDCLLPNRMMAWFLNFNWKADLLYWQLYFKLPKSKFQDLWPKWADYPNIVPKTELDRFSGAMLRADRDVRGFIGIPYSGWGSNNWVIGPSKSADGSAMLANDPHLSLQLPSLWIELHLKSPDLNVAGFTFPGTPGIVIGRNEHIAWGMTNGMIDDSDYFIESLDTLQKTYDWNKEKKQLRKENKIIHVKDKPDVYFSVYSTNHGPVFNGIFPQMKILQNISLQWVGWQNSDELLAFIKIAKAQNWEQFKSALQNFAVPAQNFVYADREGNIGYQLAGKIPVRTYQTGLLPVSGSSSTNQWTSWIPFDKLPRIYNPARGWIATANNKLVEDYPFYLSELWEPPYRIMRIEEMINEHSRIDRSLMQKFQFDTMNLLARNILPSILAELKIVPNRDSISEDAILLLDRWDYRMDPSKIAPTIYEVLQYNLIRDIFEDEMGDDLFETFAGLPNFYIRIFAQVFKQDKSGWFDDVDTPTQEKRSDIIQKSYLRTLKFLSDSLGENMENWNWGSLHHLVLKHSLGRVSLTEKIYNRGPFPAPGDGTTVNVGSYQFKTPYNMAVGASMRFIVDWGEEGIYKSILPGGNSGNFLSPYYSNQIEAWLKGELKKVILEKEAMGQRIRLLPK